MRFFKLLLYFITSESDIFRDIKCFECYIDSKKKCTKYEAMWRRLTPKPFKKIYSFACLMRTQ